VEPVEPFSTPRICSRFVETVRKCRAGEAVKNGSARQGTFLKINAVLHFCL
jgi:hypothetical protein